MHSSILIASFLAIATMAAPTPAAPELKCKTYCCQSLQLPDSPPMTRLLSSLNIPRSDITGLIGIGCIPNSCPTKIIGVPSCCVGPTSSSIVTSGCVEA